MNCLLPLHERSNSERILMLSPLSPFLPFLCRRLRPLVFFSRLFEEDEFAIFFLKWNHESFFHQIREELGHSHLNLN
jgi:hypothetical protein